MDTTECQSLGLAIIKCMDAGPGAKLDMAAKKAIIAESRAMSDEDKAWYEAQCAKEGFVVRAA